MKNLIAYLVVLPVEASIAVIVATLLLVIAATVLITLACLPAHAGERGVLDKPALDKPAPEMPLAGKPIVRTAADMPANNNAPDAKAMTRKAAGRQPEMVLRDPTRPLASTTPRTGNVAPATTRITTPATLPQLQMVLTASDRRYAVIDGELLAVGDSLRGMSILAVHDESVVLKTPNGARTLPLSTAAEMQGN